MIVVGCCCRVWEGSYIGVVSEEIKGQFNINVAGMTILYLVCFDVRECFMTL